MGLEMTMTLLILFYPPHCEIYSYVSCKNDAPYSNVNMNLCSFFRLEQKHLLQFDFLPLWRLKNYYNKIHWYILHYNSINCRHTLCVIIWVIYGLALFIIIYNEIIRWLSLCVLREILDFNITWFVGTALFHGKLL